MVTVLVNFQDESEAAMPSATALAFPQENLIGWERAMIAFLVEKERRSGSVRTVEGYSRMLQDFFGRLGKAPDQVTVQEVFIWAHGKGVSGKDPSPVTIGARMACLSSFAWTSSRGILATGWRGRGQRLLRPKGSRLKRSADSWP
jgi:hypothetical protein